MKIPKVSLKPSNLAKIGYNTVRIIDDVIRDKNISELSSRRVKKKKRRRIARLRFVGKKKKKKEKEANYIQCSTRESPLCFLRHDDGRSTFPTWV